MENYFSTFAIEPAFDIELNQLNRQYRELAVQYHPDKFINSDSSTQRQAVQKSTQLNEAYKTLKNPVTRASYLLNKVYLEPHGETFVMEQYHVTDAQLLMQQIEYREQLSEINEQQDIDQLSRFQKQLKSIIQATFENINNDFVALTDGEQIATDTLIDLKNQICELRFLEKLNHDADELEEQLLAHM